MLFTCIFTSSLMQIEIIIHSNYILVYFTQTMFIIKSGETDGILKLIIKGKSYISLYPDQWIASHLNKMEFTIVCFYGSAEAHLSYGENVCSNKCNILHRIGLYTVLPQYYTVFTTISNAMSFSLSVLLAKNKLNELSFRLYGF